MPLMMPSSFHPTGDGDYLLLGDDHGQNMQEIRRHSPHDADAYDRYHHDLDRVVPGGPAALRQPAARTSSARTPRTRPTSPGCSTTSVGVERKVMHDVVAPAHRQRRRLARRLLRARRGQGLPRLARASSAPRSGRCRPAPGWCCSSTRWASTTATSGSWAFHKGGNGGFTQVLARAAEAFGAEIRLASPVSGVLTERRPRHRRRPRGRHRAPRPGRGLRARRAAHLPRARRPARAAGRPRRQRGAHEATAGSRRR